MSFDNFPRNNIPKDVKKRESHLYNITGLIQPSYREGVCAVFGGYFRYDVKSEKICDGQLVDSFGESEILNFGFMNDSLLNFDKKYVGRNDIIHYKYEKNKKGIWEGRYSGEATGEGITQCVTSLIDKNAFAILCGRPRFV